MKGGNNEEPVLIGFLAIVIGLTLISQRWLF